MGRLFMPILTFSGSDHCHVNRNHSTCRNLPKRPDCRYIRRPQPREHQLASLRQPSLFDVLMTGVLGQLHDKPMPARWNRDAELTQKSQRRYHWVNRINMQGFEPEEISVKVDDYVIHIKAKHTEESESGNDIIERYRKVSLPRDVNAVKLSCFIAENGTLILRAPYKATKIKIGPCACEMHGMVSTKGNGCKQTRDTEKENGNERTTGTGTTDVPTISKELSRPNCYGEENTPNNPPREKDATDLPYIHDCNDPRDDLTTEAHILTPPAGNSSNITDQEIETTPEEDVKPMEYRPDATEINNETTSLTERTIAPPHDIDGADVSQESIDFVFIDKEGEQLPGESTQIEDHVIAQANNDVLKVEDFGNEDHSITFADVSTRGTEEIKEGGDTMFVNKGYLDKEDLANEDHSYTITDNPTSIAEKPNPNGGGDVIHANDGVLDIKEVGNDINEEHSIPVMDETTRIIEEPDNTKRLELTLNLQPFKPKHTSLRWSNGMLQVDVQKEAETDSGEYDASENVHREFTLPANGVMDEAVAAMNQAGQLRVTIPLISES